MAGLEGVGWRLGLERMRLLTQALGLPQHRFTAAHVVGTNGKTSVARQLAALLEAHGERAGAYLSPHLGAWSERVEVGGAGLDPDRFAEAVDEVERAIRGVERRFEPGERVTQFEAATAAAFLALARSRVRFAAIEAGLGGRLDATNVIDSRVTVLTSVGLDHTQWLGESELEIAAEKLAVLRPQTTLVHGPLDPSVSELAHRRAAELGCEVVAVDEPLVAEASGLLAGAFQRRNLAVAAAACEALLGRALEPGLVAEVARGWRGRGRFEIVAADPPLIRDAAHNPAAAAALGEALEELVGETAAVACVAILADKDAAGILEALAPRLRAVIATSVPEGVVAGSGRPESSFHPPAELARLAADLGLEAEVVEDPAAAVARTVERARATSSVALVTGSHYLLGYADGP